MKGKKYFEWLGAIHSNRGYHYTTSIMESRGWPDWARYNYLLGVHR